jgi:hypothetical protein
MLDERHDAAVVVELVGLPVALVVERDDNPPVEERELPQALREDVEAENRGLEDLGVRPEGDLFLAASLPVASSSPVGPPSS